MNRAARADVTYAFIACYCALVFGRSLYLGEPMAIPLHRLESGALLLFTFFMISDPKTTPDSRAGRVLFAALVAFGAWYVQFRLFRTNGLLWSLAACSLDRAAHRSAAARQRGTPGPRGATDINSAVHCCGRLMKEHTYETRAVRCGACCRWSPGRRRRSLGFCGFYVAKADTKLFNKASQVVLVRDGDRTVMTMANDFKGS